MKLQSAAIIIIATTIISSCERKNEIEKVFEERVVVTNRASASLSYIDANSNEIVNTQTLSGSEPMYIVYVASTDRIYVGDRAQNKILVINPTTQTVETSVGVGKGVLHMWADGQGKQLWVANDIDKTISVINLSNNTVVQTITLTKTPHEVFVSKDGSKAYISVLTGNTDPDSVFAFSTSTFARLSTKAVGKMPHIFHSPANNKLYVPCQSGTLFILNPDNLNEIATTPLPGGHGLFLSPDEKYTYVANITNQELYTVNNSSNTMVGSAIPALSPVPHNLTLNETGTRLFVAHSGAAAQLVSIYNIANGILTPVKTIATGTNPNAPVYYKREVK